MLRNRRNVLEFPGMSNLTHPLRRCWQVTLALSLLSSQTLLLAHVHEQDAAQAQYASCLTCVAAQHASPACPNSFPAIDMDIGLAPFVAETVSALQSAAAPAARQRSPPTVA